MRIDLRCSSNAGSRIGKVWSVDLRHSQASVRSLSASSWHGMKLSVNYIQTEAAGNPLVCY